MLQYLARQHLLHIFIRETRRSILLFPGDSSSAASLVEVVIVVSPSGDDASESSDISSPGAGGGLTSPNEARCLDATAAANDLGREGRVDDDAEAAIAAAAAVASAAVNVLAAGRGCGRAARSAAAPSG